LLLKSYFSREGEEWDKMTEWFNWYFSLSFPCTLSHFPCFFFFWDRLSLCSTD
jgi:hypothetical protein